MREVPLLQRCELHDIVSFTGAVSAGSTLTLEPTKLAALGRRVKRVGASLVRPRLAALLIYTTHGATVGTTDGTISGFRRHEAYRVQIAPDGWPTDFAVDAYGADLAHLARMQLGKASGVQAADLASGGGAVSAEQMVPYFFDRPDGYRNRDGGVDPIVVGRGSIQISVRSLITVGLTVEQLTAARIVAALDYDHPGLPVFSKFSVKDITSQLPAGRIVFQGRRLEQAYLRVDGGQAAGTSHLAGSFEESRSLQWWLNGELQREDTRIDELNDCYNLAMQDAAAEQVRTAPNLVPLIGPYRMAKTAQLPTGDRDSRFEFSGDIRDTATGTGRNVLLAVKETYPVVEGSSEDAAYRNASGIPAAAAMHPVLSSKNVQLDAAKADAVPRRAKIVPASTGQLSR